MAIKKVEIRPEGINDYADIVYPKTSADQVIANDGKTVETKLGELNSGKANTSHTHTKVNITDFPTTMTPTAHNHTKANITDFPTTMPPSAHTHAYAPTNHASSGTGYGVGTAANYGHVKVRNDLVGTETSGATVSPSQIKALSDNFIPLNGVVTYTDSIPANTEITKTIPMGANRKHARVYVQNVNDASYGAEIYFITNLTHIRHITLDFSGKDTRVGFLSSDHPLQAPSLLASTGLSDVMHTTINLTSMYISGSNLIIKFKNIGTTGSSALRNLITWEAMN